MSPRFVTVSVEIEAKVRPPKLTVPDPWNPAPAWPEYVAAFFDAKEDAIEHLVWRGTTHNA